VSFVRLFGKANSPFRSDSTDLVIWRFIGVQLSSCIKSPWMWWFTELFCKYWMRRPLYFWVRRNSSF